MIHLYTTPDQENYCKLVGPILAPDRVQLSFSTPVTFSQVHLAAKAAKVTGVVVANSHLLSLLLNKVDDIQEKSPTLDDFAGSLINHDGIDYLVTNPPAHIITTSTGRFLWSRYASKLTQRNKWPAQPVFRWTLATPSNVESLYNKYVPDCSIIAIDIETVSEPAWAITCCVFSCLSFNPDTNGCPYSIHSIVIPVAYANPGEHEYMLAWLRKFCDTPQPKVTQNGKYDNAWLLYYHSPVRNWLFDTAHMFHSWFSELPKRLDFIAAFTEREVTFWKNDKGDRESYFRYNARDGYNTAVACINILNEWPAWAERNYRAEFPLVFPCLLAELTGIKGDRSKFEEMRDHTDKAMAVQRAELELLTATKGFNPASPQQVQKLIEILGAKDVKGTGKVERDKVSARHPLNRFLLDKVGKYRETAKLRSSYLKDGILTKGDRILYCLNPHGTDTGRLASKESAFWVGLQIQNIPRDKEDSEYNVKEFFISDPGFYLGECDRKTAESYGTAYITGDEGMLAALNSGKDFHGTNASRFFGIPYEKIVSETGKTLDKPLRDLSKRTNHGATYMMQEQMLLDTMGIQRVVMAKKLLGLPANWPLLKVTKFLLDRFEEVYPLLRGEYATWVKNTAAGVHMLVGATGWTRYCFEEPNKSKHAWNSYVAHGAQSLNAMELNLGWLRVFNEIWLPNQRDFKLCAQIHDSILFQYRIGRIDLAWKVKECMENPLEVTDFRGTKRTMLIPADLSGEATRWSETRKLER
jgi:DNA polymerase I-like protein with 3'-5' exonuclease and polymerase domains